MSPQNEIIIYEADDSLQLEVRLEDETVWLTQMQMAELFKATKQNVSLHINNIFKEGELDIGATVKKSLTVRKEGGRTVKRSIESYNLDVIISVGYRVKSVRGTQFRIWANHILKEYLLRGYTANQRFERIEKRLNDHDEKFDLLIKTSLPPVHGIFFDGQIYDAYEFVSKLIRTAKNSIILIDNYIDDTVLTILAKRGKAVKATVFTPKISNQLHLDLSKFNAQYPPIEVKLFSKSHDRFLIIDNTTLYHIGASLKDLGKKWFAFSKMDLKATGILAKLSDL